MFTDFMEWVYDAASENQRKLVGKQVYGGKPPYDEVDSIKSAFSGEPEDPDYSPWLPTRPLGTDMPRSSAGHCEPVSAPVVPKVEKIADAIPQYNGEDTLYNLLRDLAIRQATLHFRLQHYTRAAKGTYFNIERVRTEIEDEKRKATSEAVFGAPPRSLATERPGSSGGRRRPKVREEPFNMEKKYLQMSQSMGGLARAFTKLEGIQNELQAELLKSNEVLVAIESMNRLVARQQAEDNCSEADIRYVPTFNATMALSDFIMKGTSGACPFHTSHGRATQSSPASCTSGRRLIHDSTRFAAQPHSPVLPRRRTAPLCQTQAPRRPPSQWLIPRRTT